jgi:PAS domain-containing protein
MKTTKMSVKQSPKPVVANLIGHVWEKSWTYIKTVVDIVREPILILDKDLRVMVANEPFYQTFQVVPEDTEGKVVYELGNGQWDVPALRKLLEDILPKNTFFKGFEVIHEFPIIGRKVMILNARELHKEEGNATPTTFPPIILLAIEDVTEMMAIAETLAEHAKQIESKFVRKVEGLEMSIKELEKEVDGLIKREVLKEELRSLNGKN